MKEGLFENVTSLRFYVSVSFFHIKERLYL